MDHDEQIADLDRIAHGDADALHAPLSRRAELILHLHRLDDEDLLAGLHGVAGADGDGHDAAGDDRPHLDGTARRPSGLGPAGPLAELRAALGLRIHLEAPAIDEDLADHPAPVAARAWRPEENARSMNRVVLPDLETGPALVEPAEARRDSPAVDLDGTEGRRAGEGVSAAGFQWLEQN